MGQYKALIKKKIAICVTIISKKLKLINTGKIRSETFFDTNLIKMPGIVIKTIGQHRCIHIVKN